MPLREIFSTVVIACQKIDLESLEPRTGRTYEGEKRGWIEELQELLEDLYHLIRLDSLPWLYHCSRWHKAVSLGILVSGNSILCRSRSDPAPFVREQLTRVARLRADWSSHARGSVIIWGMLSPQHWPSILCFRSTYADKPRLLKERKKQRRCTTTRMNARYKSLLIRRRRCRKWKTWTWKIHKTGYAGPGVAPRHLRVMLPIMRSENNESRLNV